jgi:hypothetical protein
MITDPGVIADLLRTFDPCNPIAGTRMGKWTFGRLISEMAGTNNPSELSDFVLRWLNRWSTTQTINGFPVPARAAGIQSQIIDPWQTASGGPGNPLDLSMAPFRLLAIVNRTDLRDNTLYGGGSAGEGRFVFGAFSMSSGGQCGGPLPFTVIFEYGIPVNSCAAAQAWGEQWYDLKNHPLGCTAYNAALEAITDQFTLAGADPSKPNNSALNQLRTNEIALDAPWQLREFVLGSEFIIPPGTGIPTLVTSLVQTTVKQSPANLHNGTPLLVDYINTDAAVIAAQQHAVTAIFQRLAFLVEASEVTFALLPF